jgi:O-acetyl-ADP-ribose deacetylase (regulator of RNase III)
MMGLLVFDFCKCTAPADFVQILFFVVQLFREDGMDIQLIQGDITKVSADAIVNAANSSLMGGGGVDGAIHRAGGPEILAECREIISRIGSCNKGQVVPTSAGRLKARYVFHTVGPVWQGGAAGEAELLARCYEVSLELARELGLSSIAFPAISCGVYGYPKEEAVQVVRSVVDRWHEKTAGLTVIFVNLSRDMHRLYEKMFAGDAGANLSERKI